MKKIFSILAACAILWGCSDDSKDQNTPFIPEGSGSGDTAVQTNEMMQAGDNQLKVISFNIRTGNSDKGTVNAWDTRKVAVPSLFKAEKPTVFGLQEALGFQVSYLREELPDYDCYGVGREDGKSGGEHMSIFYRKSDVTLEKYGTFWLSETPDTPSKGWDASYKRSATWAIFTHKATSGKFFYINTHFDHQGELAQQNSVLLILDKLKELNPENYPVVLTADFNTTSSDKIFDPLKKVMKDVREEAPKTDTFGTFNDWGKIAKSIDHIFCSDFTPVQYRTIRDPYENITLVSDHYPISAILEFK